MNIDNDLGKQMLTRYHINNAHMILVDSRKYIHSSLLNHTH